ncbi:MAG TPA: thioredoxin fold domain-containing protein [Puia sp.]|nr:thioredoxin fold domain-containing protein [Puia sp.]
MYRLLHTLILFTGIALSVHLASAQDTPDRSSAGKGVADGGVRFEHDLSWAQIKAKANSEQKYLFVDCFTTWCGPCRFMRTTIFPQPEMGSFFNDKFVSAEVQLDTTANDNDHVKGWYADAHALMTQYAIQAFPTYLIFAPDGRLIHRIVGGTETAQKFIDLVEQTFDTTKQYYTQLRQFEAGRRDSSFLRRLAQQSLDAYDLPDGQKVFNAWLAAQTSPYTPTGLQLMEEYTHGTADPGFAIFLHHAPEANKILGANEAQRLVTNILLTQYVIPQIRVAGPNGPDFASIQHVIAAKYPAQAAEVTASGKVLYFKRKKDWPHFETAIVAYMQQYGAHATAAELNDYAWTVFSNCPDMTCVADALAWSKRSFKDKPVPGYMDTYANILYKMGKKTEALAWEQKALNLSSGDERAGYQATLDKMRKGERTWN